MILAKVIYSDGKPVAASMFNHETGTLSTALPGQHANFDAIVRMIEVDNTDSRLKEMFDVEAVVANAFSRVSDKVTLRNGVVLFDGDPLHEGVANQISRLIEENAIDRARAVALFAEKVMANPQVESREQLFDYLVRHRFTITNDGLFVGYKGCSDLDGVPVSTRRAPEKDMVSVDGKLINNDYVRNTPGAVVEMPRSLVDFNAYEGCS